MYALVKHIIKTHKKHVASRRADINRYRAYASRDLSSGMYGNDVDRMTDLLVENDVLNAWDRTVSHKWSHIKYNRKVKNSVKRMQARMGRKKTGKASKTFLMSLQQWKDTKNKLTTAFSKDSLDLKENHDALLAVAILLVEKGYMKNYYADDIRNQGVGECDHFLRPLDYVCYMILLDNCSIIILPRLRLMNFTVLALTVALGVMIYLSSKFFRYGLPFELPDTKAL